MTAIALTPSTLHVVKRVVLNAYPEARSGHLTEALAQACGFETQAALLAHMADRADDPDIVLLDDRRFNARLAALDPELEWVMRDPYWFDLMTFPKDEGIFATFGDREGEQYRTQRDRAWRNAMIAAINTGIARRHFTVRPGDNRWTDNGSTRKGATYRFEINGVPALAHVHDGGFDELMFTVALWPTPDGHRWIRAFNAGFSTGDLFASGWLERQDGAWLQFNGAPILNCRRGRLAEVAEWGLRPLGYADTGPFKM